MSVTHEEKMEISHSEFGDWKRNPSKIKGGGHETPETLGDQVFYVEFLLVFQLFSDNEEKMTISTAQVFDAVHSAFDWMPLGAVVAGKVLVLHGGLGRPKKLILDHFRICSRHL